MPNRCGHAVLGAAAVQVRRRSVFFADGGQMQAGPGGTGSTVDEDFEEVPDVFACDPVRLGSKPAKERSQRIAVILHRLWLVEANLHLARDGEEELSGGRTALDDRVNRGEVIDDGVAGSVSPLGRKVGLAVVVSVLAPVCCHRGPPV